MTNEALERIAQLKGGRCQVTLKPFKKKGFVIHHIREIEDDILRNQFPTTPKGKEQYYDALESLVIKDPERFALITNAIHHKLDGVRNGITRLKMDNRIRFCGLALLTDHSKPWEKKI